MLRFQHNDYLLILALVPVLVLLYILMLMWRRKRLSKIGDEQLVNQQMIGFIPGRRTLKFVLLTLAFALSVIGLANLQAGGKAEQMQRKGVDVIIALDVSKSMLAKDIQPDRLTRAKQLIERMLDKMRNDRVGLIIFAGRSYLQVPLTIDYSSMRMMLQNVRPDLVPTQGTVIGDAIDLALKSFSQKEKKYKSLVIISDGEDHDAQAKEKTREATDNGVIVHTVGVGSPQGATLYDPETKAEKLDEQGNPVISKLNEEELKSIAAAGRGSYTLLNNADDAATKITDQIDSMEQRNMGVMSYTDFNSYFQYFLLPALLLIIIEWLIPGARNTNKSTRKKTVMATALLLLAGLSAHAQEKSLVRKGNELYQQKKYKEAAAAYQQAVQKNPAYVPGSFNLGNSLIQQNQLEAARKVMTATAKNAKASAEQSGANYNIGNTYMQEQKWSDAINAYKQALRKNPQDADAKYNLSYALAKMKQDQNGGGGKDKNKDNKNNKDQKNKNDKNKDQKNGDNKDQQDKNKQDKKDQQQDKKDGQDKEDNKDQKRPEPQPSKLSQQQADNLLNALQQDERKLQDKVQKGKGVPVKVEKDW